MRRLFQNTWVDPGYWQKQFFVCEALDPMLPKMSKLTRKLNMTVVEINPIDAKYVNFLKPTDTTDKNAWYLDHCHFIGSNVGVDGSNEQNLKKEMMALGAQAYFQLWNKPTQKWNLMKRAVDMVLLSDGATTSLGPLLESALLEARRVLKDAGRFYIVANHEDELCLGGSFENGLMGSVVDKCGFELIAAKRGDCGVVVGCIMKKKVQASGAKRRAAVATKKKPSKVAPGRKRPSIDELLT